MLKNNQIISFFKGEWTFIREINSNGLPYGRANGVASFQNLDTNRLNYHEKGHTYILNNKKSIPFHKQFLYECNYDTLTVYFADGVDNGKVYQYYILQEQEIRSVKKHVCGNDLYESYYMILSQNEFILKTVIGGPKKDFEITSHFLRS